MTSKDAVLKKIRLCVLAVNQEGRPELWKYIDSYLKDQHIRHGFLCVHDKVVNLQAMKKAMIESLHMSHHINRGLTEFSGNTW